MAHPFNTDTTFGADLTREAIEKVLNFLPDNFDPGAVLTLQAILSQRGCADLLEHDDLCSGIDLIMFG